MKEDGQEEDRKEIMRLGGKEGKEEGRRKKQARKKRGEDK